MTRTEKLIGARIKEVRLSKGFTQAMVAEKINVSVETISRLERGVSFPSLRTMEDIAQSLGVPLKAFFDFDENQPGSQPFERELSKLIAFLRTLSMKEISTVHEILRIIFKKLRKSS